MKPKPKPPVKLPRARVLYACAADIGETVGTPSLPIEFVNAPSNCGHKQPCAVIPCRNRQEARGIVRLHGMSRFELIDLITPIIHAEEKWAKSRAWSPSTVASRILQALHLIP